MVDRRRIFGTSIEKRVAEYLARQGYHILERQWKCSFGEIDLVCRQDDEIVFVEVKARTSASHGYPEESVHAGKLKKIVCCALLYLHHLPADQSWRIDVVAVEAYGSFRLTHLKAVDIPEASW